MNKSLENLDEPEAPCISMIVDGSLTISGLPKENREEIKSWLELLNPSYQQAIRINPRAKYAISEYIRYYQEDRRTGDLIIGRGNLERIRHYLERRQLQSTFVDRRTLVGISKRKTSTITLRDYQQGIPDTLSRSSQGIIKLYTGYGKTLIALKVAELLQQKTLIIVPTAKIYDQFVQEYNKYFDSDIGQIQGNKFDVKDITVAMVQTLKNRIN